MFTLEIENEPAAAVTVPDHCDQEPDIKTLYQQLSSGKKRLLMSKYTSLFGGRSTFFNKINGVTPMRKSEQLFFLKCLQDGI